MVPLGQAVRERHAKLSREMIVARPRPRHRFAAGGFGAMARGTVDGELGETFENARDGRRTQPEIAMAATRCDRDEPAFEELAEVAARGRGCDSSSQAELGGG